MKKTYVTPDLEPFSVRPDEQIAATCMWENNGYDPSAPTGASGYDCFMGTDPGLIYGMQGS